MIPAEAIERVIDELETRIERLKAVSHGREIIGGAIFAYELTIIELRKVLDDYGRIQ